MSEYLQPVASDERKSHLATAVQQEVARGGRVESHSDYNAIVRYGQPVNHTLHLILTLVTVGLWSIVWLIVWIVSVTSNKAVTLTVDEYGNILRQEM
ncbi:hypothetical protein GCM10010234_43020 [Streptomyces hawaiiensis]|uniref:hypothetical protein n=1 Tax=Streptomyces hawaiiensis TaxID=67305 RepID=UPI0031D065C1